MPAAALATLEARASADMVLTPKPEYSVCSIKRVNHILQGFFTGTRQNNVTDPVLTKPLSEPMSTSRQSCSVAFIWQQFERKCSQLKSVRRALKLHFKYNCQGDNDLTHWGRVTHICVSNLIIIGSDNGLSPGRRQAIIWTNAGILLIGLLGTNFSEILIEICIFSFKKMHLKMSSG